MIKRYNQFVKGKVNEDYELGTELEAPVRDLPSSILDYKGKDLGERPPINPPTDVEMESEFEGEEEEVATDKYEMALQNLADAAGVDFTPGQKSVIIGEKEVTFPAETEKYHINGVKKSFTTPEDVLANLGGHSSTPTEQKKEVKDEMTSLKDEEIIDSGEQFESKSYKATRRRDKR